jgi:TRAP-type C4-dicarboxylate transport system permease small subunit
MTFLLSLLPQALRGVVGSKVFLWGLSIFLVLSVLGFIYLRGYWSAEEDMENLNNKATVEALEKRNEIEREQKNLSPNDLVDRLGIPR